MHPRGAARRRLWGVTAEPAKRPRLKIVPPTSPPLTHEQRLDIAARILLAGAERVLAEREAEATASNDGNGASEPTPH